MMVKRDLKADLELCHGFAQELETAKYRTWGALNATYDFAHKAREGWPHAIERALEAEALVRELVDGLQALFYGNMRGGKWVKAHASLEKAKKELGDV